jgi:adenine-specific DNA-methyltransferase
MQNATRRDEISKLLHDYFNETKPEAKTTFRQSIDGLAMAHLAFNIGYKRDEIEVQLRQQRGLLAGKRVRKKGWSKDACERAIASLENELAELVEKGKRLRELEHKPERPFFLWHLWFRHVLKAPPAGRGGFDIVIANPPYVRQESIKDQKTALQAEPYECYDGLADLLVYFYERAVKLLRPGGVLTFITSNKFYRAGYGEKLRGFLARELTLHRLIDFGDAPVFEAIAYASILEGTKAAAPSDAAALAYTWEKQMPLDRIEPIMVARGQGIRQSELTPSGWGLESPVVFQLLAKIRKAGKPLGEYVKQKIYFGIKTGLNEAFVIDRATRDKLIREHKSSAEILKPFLRGRDVKRWRAEFSEQYLVKIESSENKTHPWSDKSAKDAAKIFSETYPAIYEHFQSLRDIKLDEPDARGCRNKFEQLQNRDDQGKYFWELRSCVYWHEFEKPKILYPDIYEHQSLIWDESEYFAANTCYFISTNEKWLTGLLNSQTVEWFYATVSNKVRGGYMRALSDYMKQIPIPAASAAEQAALSGLVDGILAAKRTGDAATVTALESEIDAHVFRLYALTPAEIKMVKDATKS